MLLRTRRRRGGPTVRSRCPEVRFLDGIGRYPGEVADATQQDEVFDVDCPHCSRRFESKLLLATADVTRASSARGWRLFVAYERATENDSQ